MGGERVRKGFGEIGGRGKGEQTTHKELDRVLGSEEADAERVDGRVAPSLRCKSRNRS